MNGLRATLSLALLLIGGAHAQENAEPPTELDPDTLQTNPADAPEGAPAPAPVAGPKPWEGTFAGGMSELARLAESEPESALALSDRLLAPNLYGRVRARLEGWSGGWSERALAPLDPALSWLGLETLDAPERAEVRYARGLVQAASGAVLSAAEELSLARALAGSGRTREDAVYALGTMRLELAEELRQRIPEIGGQAPAAPAPPAGPGAPTTPGAAPGGPQGDPLPLARAAYLEAREHFVERLRLDWRDADTRANVELVQRRLRELDEIERRREQEKQDQQDDSQQQQQQQQQEQQQDPQQQQDDSDEPQDSSQEKPDSKQADPEQDPKSQDEPQEGEPSDSEEETEQQEASEPEERVLTEEEMKRLLQLLQRYQEQGEEAFEELRRVRRERVERDW